MARNLPSAAIRKLVALSERKDALMSKVQEIDREMLRIQRKSEVGAKKGGKPAKVTVRRVGKREG